MLAPANASLVTWCHGVGRCTRNSTRRPPVAGGSRGGHRRWVERRVGRAGRSGVRGAGDGCMGGGRDPLPRTLGSVAVRGDWGPSPADRDAGAGTGGAAGVPCVVRGGGAVRG